MGRKPFVRALDVAQLDVRRAKQQRTHRPQVRRVVQVLQDDPVDGGTRRERHAVFFQTPGAMRLTRARRFSTVL